MRIARRDGPPLTDHDLAAALRHGGQLLVEAGPRDRVRRVALGPEGGDVQVVRRLLLGAERAAAVEQAELHLQADPLQLLVEPPAQAEEAHGVLVAEHADDGALRADRREGVDDLDVLDVVSELRQECGLHMFSSTIFTRYG